MVKISNTPEGINTRPDNQEKEKLTPEIIKKLITEDKKTKSTTSVNIRLETSISNQIELQAKQVNTSKTEIIKGILTDFYNNKMITKGSFNLAEPVNLIIPKSVELIKEYENKKINIISSIVKEKNDTYINPLDPHNELYNNTGFELVPLNQGNNILDTYDPEKKCYYDSMINDSHIDYSYHRGLIIKTIRDTNDNLITVLIDLLISENELYGAYLITIDEGIHLSSISNNTELITYLHRLQEYEEITELVSYNNTNKELRDIIKSNEYTIQQLLEENDELKNEIELLNEDSKRMFNEKEDNDLLTYVEELESKNRELEYKLKQYHEESIKSNEILNQLENMIKNHTHKNNE